MTDELDVNENEEQDLFEHLRIVVDKGQGLLRIDKFLMHRVEYATRNRIQNAILAGSVRVNELEIKASYKVKPDDVITVVLPDPPRDREVYPENIPLTIPYEDDDVLIVNKEAGMVVHPGFNNYDGTLVNALVYHIMAMYEDEDQGKWSVTHYKVLERLGYVTLIECQLETGRTHQIRTHLQSIGHPLFSDTMYGGNKILKGTMFNKYKQFVENCFKILPRQALHAQKIGFIHPVSKEERSFEAPLPEDFQQCLEKWRSYVQYDRENN